MWTPADIAHVSHLSVQKWLPFPISSTEITNYIGNLTIAPNAIPTNQRSKHILHAIIRELILAKKIKTEKSEFEAPQELISITSSDEELCSLLVDSVAFPDYSFIKKPNDDIPLATLIQIHPVQRNIKGVGLVDFGLTERQTIHFSPQLIIKIPFSMQYPLKLTIALTEGNTSLKQYTDLAIPASRLGLIIDTRDKDILETVAVGTAKQLVNMWCQSFDLHFNEQ